MGKRWKPAVIWKVNEGCLRFKELKKSLPYISDKMLSSTLSELEADSVIEKAIYKEVPLRVEYTLTAFGNGLLPILIKMNEWGTGTLKNLR